MTEELQTHRIEPPAVRPSPLVQCHSLCLSHPHGHCTAVKLEQRLVIGRPARAQVLYAWRVSRNRDLRQMIDRLDRILDKSDLPGPLKGGIIRIEAQEDLLNPIITRGGE